MRRLFPRLIAARRSRFSLAPQHSAETSLDRVERLEERCLLSAVCDQPSVLASGHSGLPPTEQWIVQLTTEAASDLSSRTETARLLNGAARAFKWSAIWVCRACCWCSPARTCRPPT